MRQDSDGCSPITTTTAPRSPLARSMIASRSPVLPSDESTTTTTGSWASVGVERARSEKSDVSRRWARSAAAESDRSRSQPTASAGSTARACSGSPGSAARRHQHRRGVGERARRELRRHRSHESLDLVVRPVIAIAPQLSRLRRTSAPSRRPMVTRSDTAPERRSARGRAPRGSVHDQPPSAVVHGAITSGFGVSQTSSTSRPPGAATLVPASARRVEGAGVLASDTQRVAGQLDDREVVCLAHRDRQLHRALRWRRWRSVSGRRRRRRAARASRAAARPAPPVQPTSWRVKRPPSSSCWSDAGTAEARHERSSTDGLLVAGRSPSEPADRRRYGLS